MATDVGAILAALATGSQAGANTGTGGNDSGINRVVGITLRLIADPGNAAAVKELTKSAVLPVTPFGKWRSFEERCALPLANGQRQSEMR